MHKGRLEAFSDGVIAILITIMVLELRLPKGGTLADLSPMVPILCSYVLSFVYLAIYWNNHHHMFQAVHRINGGVLWANSHLLFWLSLVPFATAWMGQHPGEPWPIAIYGSNLLLCAIAYTILLQTLISHHGHESDFARAVGRDSKGKISLLFYLIAIPAAFYHPAISYGCYIGVAVLWLVPDRRFERVVEKQNASHSG